MLVSINCPKKKENKYGVMLFYSLLNARASTRIFSTKMIIFIYAKRRISIIGKAAFILRNINAVNEYKNVEFVLIFESKGN